MATGPGQRAHAGEIVAEGVSKLYGGFTALDDVSLSIRAGEFLTLLGPSGSGKTTFLMVLAGFEAASKGRLSIDGRDMTGMPPEQRGFGMVFQGYALFPHMTVEQNIAFPLQVQKRGAAEIRRRVADMIDLTGLSGHARKRPSGLSGGQQQRVALARALAYEPSVLLLDEPFSALDKNLRGQMQDEVRRLHRDVGATFVFVTHDQSEALALSSRIAIFSAGRLQQLGTPPEVYDAPENRFVAEFLGEINFLPPAPSAAGAAEGKRLAIRPEHMSLHLERPDSAHVVAARLIDATYMGAETRLSLECEGGAPLSILRPTSTLPADLTPGASIWASWADERAFWV